MRIVPAPFNYRMQVGSKENYFIHDGYTVRLEAASFDDTGFTDEFQLQVYQYARQLLDSNKYTTVIDLGCGSGFKLMTNFFDCTTCGIDLQPTVDFCNAKWKGRDFKVVDLAWRPDPAPQLVICSDVIEHVSDPDVVLRYIAQQLRPQLLVISTPERDQLSIGTHNGPPKNQHHVREWNVAEFHAYVAQWFNIKEHFVMQGTQIVAAATLE